MLEMLARTQSWGQGEGTKSEKYELHCLTLPPTIVTHPLSDITNQYFSQYAHMQLTYYLWHIQGQLHTSSKKMPAIKSQGPLRLHVRAEPKTLMRDRGA